jgi:hypothetical protein
MSIVEEENCSWPKVFRFDFNTIKLNDQSPKIPKLQLFEGEIFFELLNFFDQSHKIPKLQWRYKLFHMHKLF